MHKSSHSIFSVAVLVAALGYFVDIYDLLLFSIIRVPSLQSLGLSKEQITTDGESIIIWQMAGLLIGGIIWGVMESTSSRITLDSILFPKPYPLPY